MINSKINLFKVQNQGIKYKVQVKYKFKSQDHQIFLSLNKYENEFTGKHLHRIIRCNSTEVNIDLDQI